MLLGVICLAIGEVNLRNVNAVKLEREDTVWFHAASLARGTTYGVDISPSQDWGRLFGNGFFTKAMPVNVTLTSPEGDTTSLQIFCYGEPSTSPYYQSGLGPAIVAVKYENVDSVGLTVDESSVNIRFTARQDGYYNVTVLEEGLWSKEPPDYILFSKEVIPNGETYSFLAAVGGVVCAFGGVTYIVSLFRSRNSRRRSRK